jgi:hypothetical protein
MQYTSADRERISTVAEETDPQAPLVPVPAPRPELLTPREYAFEQLGHAPRTKDDINAELLGLDRL